MTKEEVKKLEDTLHPNEPKYVDLLATQKSMEELKASCVDGDSATWTIDHERRLKAITAQISRRARLILASTPAPKPADKPVSTKRPRNNATVRAPKVQHFGYKQETADDKGEV